MSSANGRVLVAQDLDGAPYLLNPLSDSRASSFNVR